MAALSLVMAVALVGDVSAGASSVGQWQPLIAEASQRFGVSQSIIASVIRAESGGRTTLYGRPITSRAGAMGLMQLMPATWAELRAELQLGSNPYNPRDNILAGTLYLRKLGDRFGYPGMIAAYNAGPARYAAYLARRQRLPAETVAYLNAVTGRATATAITPLTRPRELMFVLRRDLSSAMGAGSSRRKATACSRCNGANNEQGGEGLVSGLGSMTGGGTALKARRCPPICCANRFPPRPLARHGTCRPVALTAAPPPVRQITFSTMRTDRMEATMTMYLTIGMASDRVLHSLATGSGIEDRRTPGDGIDRHILATEEADFHWDARLSERWLGAYWSADDDDIDLDRVAIVGRIDGQWFAATSIIDGDGMPRAMTNRRAFDTKHEAERAFEHAC